MKVRFRNKLESFVRCEKQHWPDCGGPFNTFLPPTTGISRLFRRPRQATGVRGQGGRRQDAAGRARVRVGARQGQGAGGHKRAAGRVRPGREGGVPRKTLFEHPPCLDQLEAPLPPWGPGGFYHKLREIT